jgi:hypothetical protein
MTTHTPPPAPTVSDDEARMRVFQIIGSDIYPEAPAAFTGDWHQALKTTAARWTNPPDVADDIWGAPAHGKTAGPVELRTCWFCGAENPASFNSCGFCCHRADDDPRT